MTDFNILNISAAICTLGCKVNQYESDCIISEFTRLGFAVKNFDEVCDVYVINTCTVTAQSDKKSKQMIRRAKKLNGNAIIAVCGCFSQIAPEYLKANLSNISVDILAGTADKLKIPQLALDVFKNKCDKNGSIDLVKDINECSEYENINAYMSEKTRAYIKIQDGCNAKCSYCIIPLARGKVRSRRYEDILSEVRRFNNMGYHEIVFTGIEIASYGSDLKNIDLISLLERLDGESSLENITSMRLSSLDPAYINKNFIDRFSQLKKAANHFHLSLQSGSDKILNLMRRKYNIKTVLENMGYAKAKIAGLNITADMIVGFPGESDEDFRKSADIAEELNIYHTHIFTYSKRPHTDAAKFENQVADNIKNERSRELSDKCKKTKYSILKNIANSSEKCYDVIIENYHEENDVIYYTAKTKNCIDIKIFSHDTANNIKIGSMQTVKITGFDEDFLLCEL